MIDFSSTTKYLWNATVNNWSTKADMQIGQGYIIRQMETGDFTKTLRASLIMEYSYHHRCYWIVLINPYPSALDA
jgi:hypothetical protein